MFQHVICHLVLVHCQVLSGNNSCYKKIHMRLVFVKCCYLRSLESTLIQTNNFIWLISFRFDQILLMQSLHIHDSTSRRFFYSTNSIARIMGDTQKWKKNRAKESGGRIWIVREKENKEDPVSPPLIFRHTKSKLYTCINLIIL